MTIIVERDQALPITHFTLAFDLGSLADPVGKEGTASLLFRLLRRSNRELNAPDLDRRLDALGISAGVEVSRSVAALHGTCLSRSFEHALSLVAEMLRGAPNDEQEFSRLKVEALGEWTDSLDNDSLVARRFFTRQLFQAHPYGRLTSGTPASLERIEMKDLREVYDMLVSRGRLHAAFSGDLTRENAENFVREIDATLPDNMTTAKIDVSDPKLEGRNLHFVDKPERSQVQILIGGSGAHPKDPDRTALFVGNTIFGGTFSARLSREVRGKRGWSYGAYSQLGHDRGRHSFSMWTFPQASDAPACIALELRLLERFIEDGVTKAELQAAKKYLLNSHAFALDTASKRAALALDQELYDLPPVATFSDRVNAVTLDAVNQAIRNRLSAENLIIVVLGTAAQLQVQVEAAIGDLKGSSVICYDHRE